MPDLLQFGKRPSTLHRNRQQLYRRSMELREKKTAENIVAKTILLQHSLAGHILADYPLSQAGSFRRKLLRNDFGRLSLQKECEQLKAQNRELEDELQQSRLLLSKMSRESRDTRPSDSGLAGVFDNRIAAAEMIASLDDATESDIVLRILASDGQRLSDLLLTNDALTVIRVASVLANCRAALVHNDTIVPTEFGRTLFHWIMESTR